jgi:hypothetical protein
VLTRSDEGALNLPLDAAVTPSSIHSGAHGIPLGTCGAAVGPRLNAAGWGRLSSLQVHKLVSDFC